MSFIVALAVALAQKCLWILLAWRHIWESKVPYLRLIKNNRVVEGKQRKQSETFIWPPHQPHRIDRTKTVPLSSLSLSIMRMPMPRNECGDNSNSKLAWLGDKGLERDSPRSQAQRSADYRLTVPPLAWAWTGMFWVFLGEPWLMLGK